MNAEQKPLPSQFELASLAASLTGNAHISRSTYDKDSSKRMVEYAFALWTESGKLLDAQRQSDLPPDIIQKREAMGKFRLSLMIGRHYLPNISDEFLQLSSCSYHKFLETVVGLTEKSDRDKWFRAFLYDPENELLSHWDLTDSQLSSVNRVALYRFYKKHGFSNIGEPSEEFNRMNVQPIFDERDSAELGKLLLDYIKRLPIPHLALKYRKWRLSMKDPENKSPRTHNLEVCLAKATTKSQKK